MSWGEAIAYDMSADRKAIARDAEKSVRRMTIGVRSAPRRCGVPAPRLNLRRNRSLNRPESA